MREIYFSIDVESDGPIPGPYSMLSFGCVAFDENGKELGTFSANLAPLAGAGQHPETMKFWQKEPMAWEACRSNQVYPEQAIKNFVAWVKKTEETFDGKAVFVAYPASYDFMFMYWYMIKFAGESPFSFSALDVKTYACALLKKPFRKTNRGDLPEHWFPGCTHKHIALDDAQEQGLIFLNMRKENLQGKK